MPNLTSEYDSEVSFWTNEKLFDTQRGRISVYFLFFTNLNSFQIASFDPFQEHKGSPVKSPFYVLLRNTTFKNILRELEISNFTGSLNQNWLLKGKQKLCMHISNSLMVGKQKGDFWKFMVSRVGRCEERVGTVCTESTSSIGKALNL